VSERTIDALVAEARARLPRRVQADELGALMAAGALVVDTRTEAQRRSDGHLPGAVVVERNVLEWRLDPASTHRLPEADSYDRTVVVVCDEGYASSLAAASLQDLGLRNATDLAGGYQAWLASVAVSRNTRMSRPLRSS
jgi:rhodanese-related sulfurtransferase